MIRFEVPALKTHTVADTSLSPKCALESLITVQNIEKDIQARADNHDINDGEVRNVAEQAFYVGKKLYVILAYMKRQCF